MLASRGCRTCTINVHATEVFFAFFALDLRSSRRSHVVLLFSDEDLKNLQKGWLMMQRSLVPHTSLDHRVRSKTQTATVPVSDTKWQCSWPYLKKLGTFKYHYQFLTT